MHRSSFYVLLEILLCKALGGLSCLLFDTENPMVTESTYLKSLSLAITSKVNLTRAVPKLSSTQKAILSAEIYGILLRRNPGKTNVWYLRKGEPG